MVGSPASYAGVSVRFRELSRAIDQDDLDRRGHLVEMDDGVNRRRRRSGRLRRPKQARGCRLARRHARRPDVAEMRLEGQEAVIVGHPHARHLIELAVDHLLGERPLLGVVRGAAELATSSAGRSQRPFAASVEPATLFASPLGCRMQGIMAPPEGRGQES
jgi:hypothetical protein